MSKAESIKTTVIQSNAKDARGSSYAFHKRYNMMAAAWLTDNADMENICVNIGCSISLVDRKWLPIQAFHLLIKTMGSALSVSVIGDQGSNRAPSRRGASRTAR